MSQRCAPGILERGGAAGAVQDGLQAEGCEVAECDSEGRERGGASRADRSLILMGTVCVIIACTPCVTACDNPGS